MKALEMGDWFVIAITALQVCATCAYVWKKQYLTAGLWLCFSVANVIMLILSIRGRR